MRLTTLCYIEKDGNITLRTRDNGGQEVLDFMVKQTDGANLNARLEWSDDGTFVWMREK